MRETKPEPEPRTREREREQVDDEPTVIVRHSAIPDDDAPRGGRASDSAAIARSAKAPPVGARGDGAAASSAPKKKLPARARIPKPGKRRVNRR